MTLPLSVLDLVPVPAGSTSRQAIANSIELAQLADRRGYRRYWLAEHHNTSSFVSTAPEIMINVIARETERLRVGSGGIMLPNHSSLKVAENFRTLEALHPGRIDLAIGRAPGTDQRTALALRRSVDALGADDFPEQLQELLAFCGEAEFPPGHPFAGVRAIPNDVPLPPIWLLGSSDYGARVAAATGRGFAFAFHFSPDAALGAMRAYRREFRPSPVLERPYAILAVSVVCADSEERAEELARTHDLLWVKIRSGRSDGGLPSPDEARAHRFTPQELELVRGSRRMLVVGTPERVRARLEELTREMEADELMVTSHIYSHADRLRSYELLADAFALPESDRTHAPASG
ncbi:MAG: class flavin-dependent oxidoreductase [Myxococcales bacterium]|nr:class flavin-dependent oxidoreductase [Myxococcales bacterium]